MTNYDEDFNDPIEKMIRRKLAQNNLLDYAQTVVPGFMDARHTRFLCAKLEAVERGEIKRLCISCAPGHGKPVSVDALILMGDGSYKRLGDVEVGDEVISHTGKPRLVERVFEQPAQPGVKITTRSGRTVSAAVDHTFLTPSGWVNAGDLKVGLSLGNIARPSTQALVNHPPEYYRLAGYFIGDGCCSSGNASVTNADPGIIEDLTACADALGFKSARVGLDTNFTKGIHGWLRETGLDGKTSYTKRVPQWVFQSSHENIANFLGAYFDCDGTVAIRAGLKRQSGKLRDDVAVELYSVSPELLADCQKLFLRLGIQTRLRIKWGRYEYRLAITDMDGVARFAALIPLKGKKNTLRSHYIRTKFDQPILPDVITEIESIDSLDCRCLTVAVDHTFTADDFIVHNSTIVQAWVSWFLGRNPRRRVIMLSANEGLAIRNSRFVRGHIMDPAYPFEARLSADATSVQEWRLSNGKGGLKAVGQGGIITGFRCEAIVSDDIQPDAGTTATMEALELWYREVASTRLDPDGVVVMIATRWSVGDLVARLQEGRSGAQWDIVNLPAIAYESKDALGRKPGEALWPEVWSIDKLEEKRLESTEYAWESQYQGRPMPAGGRIFHDTDLNYTYKELPTGPDNHVDLADAIMKTRGYSDPLALARVVKPKPFKVISIDCAAKNNVSSDYSVITTLMFCGGKIYVVDVDRGKWEWNELMGRVLSAAKKHAPVRRVLIEDASAGISLIQELIRTTKLPIVRMTPKDSKLERATAARGFFEGGRVYWPEYAPWKLDIMAELLGFPGGRHDDQVDSLVQGVNYLMANSQFKRERRDLRGQGNNRMDR